MQPLRQEWRWQSWICSGTRMVPIPSSPSITANTNHPSAPPNPAMGMYSPREAGKHRRNSATVWGRQCNGESQSPGIIFQTQGRTWPAQHSQHLPETVGQSSALGFQVPCAAQFLPPSHKNTGLGGQVTDGNFGWIHWTLLGVEERTGRGWSMEQSHLSTFPFPQQELRCLHEPPRWDTLESTPRSLQKAGSQSIRSFQTLLCNQGSRLKPQQMFSQSESPWAVC